MPESIVTDSVRFRQILTNVVGNAVKFSDGGAVAVRVQMRDAVLAVEVADTGRGIAPAQHEQVFLPFEQGETMMARDLSSGVGLGLTNSRRLARALGGDLEFVRSVPGEGSLFVVTVGVDATRATSVDKGDDRGLPAPDRPASPGAG